MAKEDTALETQDAAQAEDAAVEAVEGASPAAEDSRTYTQEEFDAAVEAAVKERTAGAVKERVDRANRQKRELSAQKDELAGQVASLTAELEGYRKKEQQRAMAEAVSEETGVPAEVLRGGTEEEMRAHAESLKAYIGKPSAPYVGSDGFAAEVTESNDGDWLRAVLTK